MGRFKLVNIRDLWYDWTTGSNILELNEPLKLPFRIILHWSWNYDRDFGRKYFEELDLNKKELSWLIKLNSSLFQFRNRLIH